MVQLTLKDAAAAVGKNPSTITRAARSGDLSFTKDARGQRQFDTSELQRVFGELVPIEDRGKDKDDTDVEMSEDVAEAIIDARDRELEIMEERVQELKARVDELKYEKEQAVRAVTRERDEWMESDRSRRLLLEHMQPDVDVGHKRKKILGIF